MASEGSGACHLHVWLGWTWPAKGCQLNLPGLGEHLRISPLRDPFLRREKVAVAALHPAASSPNKATTVRAQTFAYLPSPLLELFVQFASLATAAVSCSGSQFTWNCFKTRGANLPLLCVFSGRRPPRPCRASRRARQRTVSAERLQPGSVASIDPLLHFPRLRLHADCGLAFTAGPRLRVSPSALSSEGGRRELAGESGRR